MKTIQFIARAMNSPNYRLFFTGQSVSLVGTWLQLTALPWLVYRLSGSSFLLGVVGFLSQIPTFLLTPLAGALLDRMDRRRVLIITQAASLLQALLLWVLLVTNHMSIPLILVFSFILGIINAFDIPARQSFVVDLVKKEDLGNAIALNSSMVHAARMIGPTIAGFLIGIAGEASCFFLNALSFLAVIVCLLKMTIPVRPTIRSKTTIAKDIHEGIKYVAGHIPMRSIMILVAIISLTGMPYLIFMPVFAKDILHGTSQTLGILLGASGMGALCGCIYLASRQGIKGFGRLLAVSSGIFGIGIMTFSLSVNLWISFMGMGCVGFGMMMLFAISNTIIQTIVEDRMRGRVMSLYTISFMGMTPIGSFLEGSLSHNFGVPLTLFCGGAVCYLAAINFARTLPALRAAMDKYHKQRASQPVGDPAAG